jgi:hypothetical protein
MERFTPRTVTGRFGSATCTVRSCASDLDEMAWKQDGSGLDKSDLMRGNLFDELRYVIQARYPINARYGGGMPTKVAATQDEIDRMFPGEIAAKYPRPSRTRRLGTVLLFSLRGREQKLRPQFSPARLPGPLRRSQRCGAAVRSNQPIAQRIALPHPADPGELHRVARRVSLRERTAFWG